MVFSIKVIYDWKLPCFISQYEYCNFGGIFINKRFPYFFIFFFETYIHALLTGSAFNNKNKIGTQHSLQPRLRPMTQENTICKQNPRSYWLYIHKVWNAIYAYCWTSVTFVHGLQDVIILGDLNADCSYAKESDLLHMPIYNQNLFHWPIGFDADTTVSSTHCAYDRYVLRPSWHKAGRIN